MRRKYRISSHVCIDREAVAHLVEDALVGEVRRRRERVDPVVVERRRLGPRRVERHRLRPVNPRALLRRPQIPDQPRRERQLHLGLHLPPFEPLAVWLRVAARVRAMREVPRRHLDRRVEAPPPRRRTDRAALLRCRLLLLRRLLRRLRHRRLVGRRESRPRDQRRVLGRQLSCRECRQVISCAHRQALVDREWGLRRRRPQVPVADPQAPSRAAHRDVIRVPPRSSHRRRPHRRRPQRSGSGCCYLSSPSSCRSTAAAHCAGTALPTAW